MSEQSLQRNKTQNRQYQKCIMSDCSNIVIEKNYHTGELKKFCKSCCSRRFNVRKKREDSQLECEKCGAMFLPHSHAPKSGKHATRICGRCKL